MGNGWFNGSRSRACRSALAVLAVVAIAAAAAPSASAVVFTQPEIPTADVEFFDLPQYPSWLMADATLREAHETDLGAQFDEYGAAPGRRFDGDKGVASDIVGPGVAAPLSGYTRYAVGDLDSDGKPNVLAAKTTGFRVTGNLSDGAGTASTFFGLFDVATEGDIVGAGFNETPATPSKSGVWFVSAKGKVLFFPVDLSGTPHRPTVFGEKTYQIPLAANEKILDAASRSVLDIDVSGNDARSRATSISLLRYTPLTGQLNPSEVSVDDLNLAQLSGEDWIYSPGTATGVPFLVGDGRVKTDFGHFDSSNELHRLDAVFLTEAGNAGHGWLHDDYYTGDFCQSVDPNRVPSFDFEVLDVGSSGTESAVAATCSSDGGLLVGKRVVTTDRVIHQGDDTTQGASYFVTPASTTGALKGLTTQLDFPCPWLLSSPLGSAEPGSPPAPGAHCSAGDVDVTTSGRNYRIGGSDPMTEAITTFQDDTGKNWVHVTSRGRDLNSTNSWGYDHVMSTGGSPTMVPLPPQRNKVKLRINNKDNPITREGDPVPMVILASPPYVAGAGQSPLAGPTYNVRKTSGNEIGHSSTDTFGAGLSVGLEDPTGLFGFEGGVTLGQSASDEFNQSHEVTSNEQYVGDPEDDTIVFRASTFFEYDATILESSTGESLGGTTKLFVPRSSVVSSAPMSALRQAFPKVFAGSSGNGILSNILTHTPGNPGTYINWGSESQQTVGGTPKSANVTSYCDGATFDDSGPATDEVNTWPFGVGYNPFQGADRSPDVLRGPGVIGSGAHQVQIDAGTSEGAGVSITDSSTQSRLSSMTMEVDEALEVAGITGSWTEGTETGQSWATTFAKGVDFLGYVGHIPAHLDEETYRWHTFLCKKRVASGGLPIWVFGYTVDDYSGSGGLEELAGLALEAPTHSTLTTLTPSLQFKRDSGTVRDFGIELDAVGATDNQTFDQLRPITSTVAAKTCGVPAVSPCRPLDTTIAWNELVGAKTLLPNQLYRWRSTATDFFANSTTSDWDYFVTDGPPANTTLTASDLTPDVGTSITLTASNKATNAAPTYKFDLGDGRVVGPQASRTLAVTYPVAGVYPVTVTAQNSYGASTATVTLSVGPQAVDESYSMVEDGVLTKTAATGVMANDAGADSVTRTAAPAHGTLALDANGAFTYTPAANYCGSDAFSYAVRGGAAVRYATTTITIQCVNDLPVGVASHFAGLEDNTTTVNAPGVLAGAIDVDGDPISAQLVSQPKDGTVTLHDNGSFTFDPDPNVCGEVPFSWRPSDGHATGSLVITTVDVQCVNDPPTATSGSTTTNEDTPVTVDAAHGILSHAHDIDSTGLTAVLVTPPVHGTVAVADDGGFTYTPAPNYCGADQFGFTVSDYSEGSSPETVWHLNVTCVNDPPVAAPHAYSATEDTLFVVPANAGVLVGATDVDSTSLTATRTAQASHGVVALAADGSFTYTANADYCGTDGFGYSVGDGQGGSVNATASIAVACVNDAPRTVDDHYDAVDGTAVSVLAPGVLTNDTDVEGGALHAVPATVTTGLGTFTIAANGSFSYTARPGTHGTDSVAYTAVDPDGAQQTGHVTFAVKARTTLGATRASVAYNSQLKKYVGTVSAVLRTAGAGASVAGETVDFVVDGKAFCSAVTGADGVARCSAVIPTVSTQLFGHYIAVYGGAAGYLPSQSASTPFGSFS